MVGVAVDLCHEIHVDRTGRDVPSQQVLQLSSLGFVASRLHALVGAAQPAGRQHLEVFRQIVSGFEQHRAHGADLLLHSLVNQVEVGGDASGTGVVGVIGDLLEAFAGRLGVNPTHLFDQYVVDDLYHG